MKFYFYLFFLLISSSAGAQIYAATSETGSRYNPADSMKVTFDDLLLTVPTAANAYSITINSYTLGIRRLANAPSIDIAPYFATVNTSTNAFSYDSLTRTTLAVNGPASATQAVVFNLATPLTKDLYDTTYSATPTNIRRFFLGTRIMGTSFNDANNGLRIVNPPSIGSSDTIIAIMNLGVNPVTFGFSFFAGVTPDNFYTTVTGTLNDLGPVPIKLVLFKAMAVKDRAEINWATENEINSSHFDLEQSVDGVNFYKITSRNAVGNSALRKNYIYTTNSLGAGIYFFRLKSFDKDGKFTYSAVEKVVIGNFNTNLVVYGNPIKNNLSFNFQSTNGSYGFKITGLDGNQFVLGTAIANQVNNIDVSALASGQYIIEIFGKKNNQVLATKKITKL